MVVIEVGKCRIDLGWPQIRMLPQNLFRLTSVKILFRSDVLDGVASAFDGGLAVGVEDDVGVCFCSCHRMLPPLGGRHSIVSIELPSSRQSVSSAGGLEAHDGS